MAGKVSVRISCDPEIVLQRRSKGRRNERWLWNVELYIDHGRGKTKKSIPEGEVGEVSKAEGREGAIAAAHRALEAICLRHGVVTPPLDKCEIIDEDTLL